MSLRRPLLGAAVVGAVTVATAGTAFATATVDATRLAGADRYATSQTIAEATFGTDITVAVVASGENYPDALAASYLAGASGSPVVLTDGDGLSAAAADALEDIGASGVLLVGGTAAVSASVERDLTDEGYEVDRLAGADRFETARAVAEAVPEEQIGSLDADVGRTALLASGQEFADALTGGPLAYDAGLPMLLTSPGSLSTAAQGAITALGIEEVVILGGTAAVSPAVQTSLTGMGVTVRRVGGPDRLATAAAIADLAISELGFVNTHANLARGDDFADALSGAAHAGEERAPILLTASPSTLGAGTAAWLTARQATLATLHVFGGTAAVGDGTVNAAEVAAGRTP